VLLQFNVLGDPDHSVYQFWHSRNIGRTNLGHYSHPEVDRLIEQGRAESDSDTRKRIYRKIHSLMAGDRAAAFLFFRRKFHGISSRFEGVKAAPEAYYLSMAKWYLKETKEEGG
jgi:peptide/nickel transport system substrate-binding protein